VSDNIGWQQDGACHKRGSAMWFPDGAADISEAREICEGCPVRWKCGEFALAHGERNGIWAGFWMKRSSERAALWREMPKSSKGKKECPDCGGMYVPKPGDRGQCRPCLRGLVLARPYLDRLRKLHEHLTYHQMAARSGLSHAALATLKNHPPQYLRRPTAAAIMSIPLPAVMR
jgi:hypothetical protein